MPYKNEPAFINRQKELNYLSTWLEERPKHILFFYGPKSSGKTTLIYKFIEKSLSDPHKFSVKMFNLREVLLTNYEDFLQRFFQIQEPEETGSRRMRQYDLKVFRLTVETQQRLKDRRLDPFDVMKAELKELNKSDIKPIIFIDELQALDFIYFNGQRELIKELLNFFVAMTKESHLCHVLLSCSDGYFIEKLYHDSKLKKTSEIFEIDYLPKRDIVYWLNNLQRESSIDDYILRPEQIEYVWDHFGGSIWEISHLLGRFLRVCENGTISDQEIERIVEHYIVRTRSYFVEYASLDDARITLLKTIHEIVAGKGVFQEQHLATLLRNKHFPDKKALQEELNGLVRQNFLYYNPARAEYKMQGRSMELGLEGFVKMFSE